MRGATALCATAAVLAAAAVVSVAAPVNPVGSVPVAGGTTDAVLRHQASSYATTLQHVFAVIQNEYVRPVARADLAEAAVTGLYEAVREPIPPGLRQELRRADEFQLNALLTRIRESLGRQDALAGNRAVLVSLQALPRVLDPYCAVITPEDKFVDPNDGNMTGTGLEFPVAPTLPNFRALEFDTPAVIEDRGVTTAARPVPAGPVRVLNVQPGSPAQRAGLRPDDLVVKIDGLPPESQAFPVLLRSLQHVPYGTAFSPTAARPLRVTVLRAGEAARIEVAVTPLTYSPEGVFGAIRRPDGTWDFMADRRDRLAYIRLGFIGMPSLLELQAALQSLMTGGARGLVLDLRWCPGGYLREAASIAHMFLAPELPIATQRDRDGQATPVDIKRVDISFTEVTIVVLVNGATSGGGELIAAALQDHGRAIVVGQRTVGKASVQQPMEDRYRIPFKLTKGTYGRPSGKNLQRFPDSKPTDDWGVQPDGGRELPVTAALSQRLKEWHVLHTLRPAADRTALPLDDPENDPQRHAAMQILRELIGKK